MMNALGGSPGMKAVEAAVEEAILAEFREIDRLGGVLSAVEHRYQRSQIQVAAHRYEAQVNSGERPIIGLNRYASNGHPPEVGVVRTAARKQRLQASRLKKFKKLHAGQAGRALDDLSKVVEDGGNVFAQLIETVEHCSLGQITRWLHELVGHFRPAV
jgi:methylmalonyl-CoA mutase